MGMPTPIPPFQGFGIFNCHGTQGVALGFRLAAFQA
jgi:hypothetical protein